LTARTSILVPDQLAAAVGEDGWTAGETRPALSAVVGREPPDAAALWKHGPADRCAAFAGRIGGGGQANRSKEEGVYKTSVGMRHFRVFRTRRSQSWPLLGPPEWLGMEIMRQTAPMQAAGCTIEGGQEAKMRTLAKTETVVEF